MILGCFDLCTCYCCDTEELQQLLDKKKIIETVGCFFSSTYVLIL